MTFYVDPEVDAHLMNLTIADLRLIFQLWFQFIAICFRNVWANVEVEKGKDWSKYHVVVFASLNVMPKANPAEFGAFLKLLFLKHLEEVKFKPDVAVFFGQNLRYV